MSDAANRVVDSLNTDIQEEKTFNENKTPGVTPARFYDKVSFSKDEKTGKFSKSVDRIETNTKDNVVQTNELIQKAQLEVSDYTKLAAIIDRLIYDDISLVNQTKQLIIDKIAEGVSAGCSCNAATASSSGVSVGIGSNVHADRVTISVYPNLSNFGSDTPFGSDVRVNLTQGNLGTGYQTNELEENYLTDDEQEEYEDSGTVPVGYGEFKVFTGFLVPEEGGGASATCADFAAQIDSLFAVISDGRQKLTDKNVAREKVNKIKLKKTEKELNLWSFQHDAQRMNAQAESDTELRDMIINEPLFGYKGSTGSVPTLEFAAGLAAGYITIGSFVPSEGGFYLGTVQYEYADWEDNSGQTPTYHIFAAPKDVGESLEQYKDAASSDGIADDTAPRSPWDGYWNTYESVLANAASRVGVINQQHPAFVFAQGADINGKTDWYIPATNEMSIFENVIGTGGADTPSLSSHQNNPFDPGGSEEILVYSSSLGSTTAYWSSTEDPQNPTYAWARWRDPTPTTWTARGGGAGGYTKNVQVRVRLIRRVLASS